MGLFELLMDSKYDQEIFYLKRLALARLAAKHFLNCGRAGRDLDLIVNGTSTYSNNVYETFRREYGEHSYSLSTQKFPAVMSSTWISPSEDSICVMITTVKRSTWALVSSQLDMTTFYMKSLNMNAKYGVFEIPIDGGDPVPLEGEFSPQKVSFEIPIGVRDVRVLLVRALSFS
jgi:hypothetical protein